jgi:SOS-response transcriptional repressor LexA
MRGSRLLTIFAASAVALAAVAGTACGGSDDDHSSLSKSSFAKRANALCSKAKADRDAQLQQLPSTPSGAADAQKLQNVATSDRDLIRRVDALVPPEAEQDQVDEVLDAWRKRADLADQYAEGVRAMQDPATLATFTAKQAQIDAATDPVAIQLGLTRCTRGTP